MPFLMIRNDITKVAADAIVNPANRNLLQGSGTSRAIYQAAGEQELTAACEAIGRCDLGRAVCTPAFGLPAKYIFHAVCPAWHGGFIGEAKQLAGAAQTQAGFKKRRILPEEQQNTRLRIVCKAQYMGGCGFVVVCSHCQNRSKHNFCGVPSSRYRI